MFTNLKKALNELFEVLTKIGGRYIASTFNIYKGPKAAIKMETTKPEPFRISKELLLVTHFV